MIWGSGFREVPPKVMKRSSQGHSKVKLDHIRWNSFFCCFPSNSIYFRCLWWLNPLRAQHWTTQHRLQGLFYRGWYYPYQITLTSALSGSVQIYKITGRMSCCDFSPDIPWRFWSTTKQGYIWRHALGLGFIWVLFWGHDKVVWRSHQGQNSSKWLKITFFSQLHSLGMCKMVENHINLNTATQHR